MTRRKLRAVDAPASSGVDELLSGRVVRRPRVERQRKRKERRVEKLPEPLAELGDVLVAGRKISREIDFKLRFAERRIKDHCLRRFAEEYAKSGRRPEAATYEGANSVFTFIQTRRINLSEEKIEALRSKGIDLSGETELKGLRIDFTAIREHGLEARLREALQGMGVSQEVLLEVFVPDVQLKEAFFEHVSTLVERSLEKGEKLEDKIHETLVILDPANQIRNADLPKLNAVQSYKLIHEAEVVEADPIEALDD
jgi:hypothetical protein